MGKMRLKNKKEFEQLHANGTKAIESGKFDVALHFFTEADTLARHCNDRQKRLDALNPMAQALWSLGQFDKAKQKLSIAAKIATELRLLDELAIVCSNQGRLKAVQIAKQVPVSKQNKELRKNALPYFVKSQKIINNHEHLYFRYANAKHGSLIAALSQDYKKASSLTAEGLGIAFKKGKKFDKDVTYKINPSGLQNFAIAARLIELGIQNPKSREYKNQEKIARSLIR